MPFAEAQENNFSWQFDLVKWHCTYQHTYAEPVSAEICNQLRVCHLVMNIASYADSAFYPQQDGK